MTTLHVLRLGSEGTLTIVEDIAAVRVKLLGEGINIPPAIFPARSKEEYQTLRMYLQEEQTCEVEMEEAGIVTVTVRNRTAESPENASPPSSPQ